MNLEDVMVLFPEELEELLIFEDEGKYIVIRPRRFLGADNFAKVASIIKSANGTYVSAGKLSHFKVLKTEAPSQYEGPLTAEVAGIILDLKKVYEKLKEASL